MKKLLPVVIALVLFGAACTGEATVDTEAVAEVLEDAAPTEVPPTQVPAATEVPPTAVPPTAVPATEVPATDTTDDTDATNSTAGDADAAAAEAQATLDFVRNADDWCEAADAIQAVDSLDTLNFNDPAELERGMTTTLATVTAAQRLVPSEIAPDVALTIAGFATLTSGLEAVDWQFFALDLSTLNDLEADLVAATYNIELYNYNVCGLGELPEAPEPTEEPPAGEDPFAGSALDILIAQGFTEAEATCMFQGIDFTDPAVLNDLPALLAVFTECGIALDRLAELGGG